NLVTSLCMIVSALDPMDPIQVVKPQDSRTLIVEFNPNPLASHYIIRIQDTNGLFREDTVSSSPAQIASLTPYTEYFLSVLAVNNAGRSQPSPSVTVKTGTVVHHVSFLPVGYWIVNMNTMCLANLLPCGKTQI
uniref:Fibronectin type-III domain-containing protein n=1 Tax=Salarias fasciatus TaxID=181472 RepID=A0A672I5S8_SALFA